MKVKQLIEELLKCDPEATINTNDDPIHFVNPLPGYYDGCYEEHIKNDKGHIEGFRYRRDGNKVILESYTVRDAFLDCDTDDQMKEVKFEYHESLHPSQVESIKKRINDDRKYAVVINDQAAISTNRH